MGLGGGAQNRSDASGNFPPLFEETMKWRGSPPANELWCGYFDPLVHVYNVEQFG